MTDFAAELKAVASDAKAWPFAEARDLTDDKRQGIDEVLFRDRLRPSGLRI